MRSKKMEDGTQAFLTTSKRCYAVRKGQQIKYYDLTGKRIQLAKAHCGSCKQLIKSKTCGDFVLCKCEESYVDTDRWFPNIHRYGGNAKPI